MTLRWPCLLTPRDIAADLIPRPQGGMPSLDGRAQWVQSDAGVWEITLISIPLIDARVNALRSIALLLNGPATPILVPVFDRHGPWPIVNGARLTSYTSIPHSDGSFFSDGSGYSQPVIDATAAAAAFRATSLPMTMNYGGALQGGEFFSIGEFLYQVASASLTSAGPPAVYAITFLPPLREAVAAGTALNFDDPACRCTLASPGGIPLSLDSRRVGHPTVHFVEDL